METETNNNTIDNTHIDIDISMCTITDTFTDQIIGSNGDESNTGTIVQNISDNNVINHENEHKHGIKNTPGSNFKPNPNPNPKPKPNPKHYSSASLTFYSKQKGFMMCNEYRHKERKVLIHPIGGKTETYDDSILVTAIREFIEETDLINHSHINSTQLDKNGLIEHVHDLISPYCAQTHTHFDTCVNDAKKYYHKYYVLSIDDIGKNAGPELHDFLSHILVLNEFFNGKSHTEIQSICWKKLKNLRFNNKSSWMTTRFVKLISKNKLLENIFI